MKGKLIVGVGTLGCQVTAKAKRNQKGQRYPWIRFVGIETQTEDPTLQDLGPNELIGIGDVPLDAVQKNPAAVGHLVAGIFLAQLADHPPDPKKRGCLYPTATLSGDRFH